MSESLFSPHWYRVGNLMPQLKPHVEIHRHDYRGLVWYVLEDKASGRSHRFNSGAYKIIGLMNGERTINEIWDWLNEHLEDNAPTQDQIIQLLAKLHGGDLLQAGLPVNLEEVFERGKKHQLNQLKQRFGNPLTIKLSLWDPDTFLQRHLKKVSWLFNGYIGVAWLIWVTAGVLKGAEHWPQLNAEATNHVLSPHNLLLMMVLYPLIKLLHEFGHAFTAKYFGGQVHELGVSVLLFMPVPYVDVSSITVLRNKYQRILVGAAGIMVELFIAVLGLFIWLIAEPGFIKDAAYNALLIGGISSLFFNGNPLLKYDGYYILADLLEIPNLYQRASAYLIYLCQHYLFRISGLSSPATGPGEAKWFVLYGLSSAIYRLFLLWFIVVYVTNSFFVVGVLLAIGLVLQQIILPVWRGIVFVFNSPALQRNRFQAMANLLGVAAILLSTLFFLPIPSYTCSEGVVWMPEDAQLRSETNGFAGNWLVKLPAQVSEGTKIIEINDPLLATEVTVLRARLKELDSQFRGEWNNDRIKADNIMEEMRIVAEQIKKAEKDLQATQVITKKSGQLLLKDAEDLPGRFVHQGEIIGYVIDKTLPTVRVVIDQSDMGRIEKWVKNVEVRLVNRFDQVIPATIVRRVPEASNYLPSAALATQYGGRVPLEKAADQELKVKQKLFQIDLEFNPGQARLEIGQRVYVRFNHGTEPLAQQWARSFRQVFLRQFNV